MSKRMTVKRLIKLKEQEDSLWKGYKILENTDNDEIVVLSRSQAHALFEEIDMIDEEDTIVRQKINDVERHLKEEMNG